MNDSKQVIHSIYIGIDRREANYYARNQGIPRVKKVKDNK